MRRFSLTLAAVRSPWAHTRRCISAAPTRASSQKPPYSSVSENDILYEDNHLIVLTKPPTVLTQADETNDESLLDWTKSFIAEKYDKVGEAYLGLVHRIDRPCSGVIVFAKTSKAANRLSKAFSDRDVDKKYVCVVHGHVKEAGRCHHLLKLGGPDKNNRVTVRALPTKPSYGKISGEKLVEAKLGYKPLWTFQLPGNAPGERSVCTVLEIDLETGRKHQIRAQLSHIGHPICGDMKYNALSWSTVEGSAGSGADGVTGAAAEKGPVKRGRGGKGRARKVPEGQSGEFYNGKGIALHAFSLTVPHPITKERMTFTAPVPSAWESHFSSDILTRINEGIGQQKKKAEVVSMKIAVPTV